MGVFLPLLFIGSVKSYSIRKLFFTDFFFELGQKPQAIFGPFLASSDFRMISTRPFSDVPTKLCFSEISSFL
jgi:hypothetical protein